MRICPSCKTQAAEGAKFCRKCGGALAPEKAAVPQAVAKRQLLEARIKAEPQNAALLEEYGDFLFSVGLVEEALVQLHTVAEIGRGNEALLLKIAEAYRTIQQWDKAAAHIWLALEVSANKSPLYERLANVLLEGGRTEDALQALAKQAELRPDNLPILFRIRDLMRKEGKHDDLVTVCRAILEKEPRERATWSILADTLLASNKGQEAVEAFQAILALNPDDPRANLYVGIAKHDAAIHSKEATLADATALLNKAVGAMGKLSEEEQNLALLYLASAKLHSGAATLEIKSDLEEVDADKLAREELELLAECLLLFGDIAKNTDKGDEATGAYKESLRLHDSPLVRKRLAEIYGQKGDQHLLRGEYLRGEYRLARIAFEQALSYVAGDPSLVAKRDEAASRQHRKNVRAMSVVAALFVVAGLAYAFWYYGQGAFDITVNPTTPLTLKSGTKTIASADNGTLRTDLLRYGTYRLTAQKDGYETVERQLKAGLGRKTEKVEVALKPSYGTLKVNSDPPGAAVSVQNKYEKKSAITPCEITNLFALPSTIVVSLSECTPFTSEKAIPAAQALDLGTIVFKGNLKLDSAPSGAQVLIDNEPRGETPLEIAGLLAKRTLVVVRKHNVGVFAQDVVIEPQKTTDLGTVTLSNLGALKADSAPAGVPVFVDGKHVGDTPLVLNNVAVGDHQVQIEIADCAPYEKTVAVNTGDISDLGKISFVGSVKLDSDPTGADVYVEGELKGKTPITLKELMARQTRIELKYAGKGSHSATVAVKADALTDLGVLKLSLLDSGLVAFYPFKGDANDASGNGHHGTINGATLTADRFGNSNSAYSFDGVNDDISVPDFAIVPPDQRTVTLWVKPDAAARRIMDLVSKHATPSDVEFLIRIEADGKYDAKWTTGGTFFDLSSSTPNVDAEEGLVSPSYSHYDFLALTYDGSQMRFYVNDKLIISKNATGNIVHNSYALVMGKHSTRTSEEFKGLLDDVRIYNRALSPSEVQQLYLLESPQAGQFPVRASTSSDAPHLRSTRQRLENQSGPGSGLVAHYPFNGSANDESGNGNNGVISNASFVPGQIGLALSFQGTPSSCVEVPHNDVLTPSNAVTMSAWVKVREYGTWHSAIIYKAGQTPTTSGFKDRCYALWVTANRGFQISATPPDAASMIHWDTPSGLYPLNSFFHVAGIVDAQAREFRVYVNGKLACTSPYNADGIRGGSFPLRIGCPFFTVGDQSALNGELDDVRIYNRALSPSEVQELYSLESPKTEKGLGIESAEIEKVLGKWEFGRVGEGSICTLNLLATKGEYGYRMEASDANECFWELNGDKLIFRHREGRITSELARKTDDYWEGPYISNPLNASNIPGVTHYITRRTQAPKAR
jgi:tetratricopeptide (TPR) repeat protein